MPKLENVEQSANYSAGGVISKLASERQKAHEVDEKIFQFLLTSIFINST
jgi:hypothetical protein